MPEWAFRHSSPRAREQHRRSGHRSSLVRRRFTPSLSRLSASATGSGSHFHIESPTLDWGDRVSALRRRIHMRKIIVSEFVSLDGVMQAPGGPEEDTEGGFAYGGWTGPYWHDDIGAAFGEEMSGADALLLGRKTWQIHGGAFEPMPEGDFFGDIMNSMPKYVVSSTLTSATAWRNSTLIS